MVFQRIISRFAGRSRIAGHPQRLFPPNRNTSVKFSDQSLTPLSQVRQSRDLFSGTSANYQGAIRVRHNAMPRFLGNLGMKLGFAQENSLPPGSLKFANSIHSVGPKEFERDGDNGPVYAEKNSGIFEGSNQGLDDINRGQRPLEPRRLTGFSEFLTRKSADPNIFQDPNDINRGQQSLEPRPLTGFSEFFTRRSAEANNIQDPNDINMGQQPLQPRPLTGFSEFLTRKIADPNNIRDPNETGRDGRPFLRGFGQSESGRNMNFVRGIMKDNENYRSGLEQNADIVHIKIMRNNTFVTVTDSKGNKKMGASAGCLAEMKGGPKVSKYSAEATAEHVGRVAKSMGLKSVVMKVNGFTFFKKKKLAILSFRDGYTNSRSDKNPIVYIEDTTRKPHNGCRLKKQRRV